MNVRDLLFEIGTEELPPRQLAALAAALGDHLAAALEKANLAHTGITTFATPRRLAVRVEGLVEEQDSQWIEKRGPALKAAFDADGNPTLACLGFVSACGGSVDQLAIEETDKGSWVYFRKQLSGKTTISLLPQLLQHAIERLPIAKPMRWGDHDTEFVRPVHWIVLLFGEEVVPITLLGQTADRYTYGHRFHHPGAIALPHPRDYERLLRDPGRVIASYSERRAAICTEINTVLTGTGQVLLDDALLDEVTGIVEWPVALRCTFDAQFLQIPPEVLITAMKSHQKCFAVHDAQQNLLPCFVTVSNIASQQPARVIAGNQRVMRARLADAQFFYHRDVRHRLETRLASLDQVVFQQRLGTLGDKARRLTALTSYLAAQLGMDGVASSRAALLCKADLVTAMVGEFPELQGVMGYYYALADSEPQAVALAIREHYLPRFAGDELPASEAGCLVSIADRVDTLVGLMGINQPPSGEKDPYGLRRAALGALRIMIERRLAIDLHALLSAAYAGFADRLSNPAAVQQTFDFMMERLRAWYADRGITTEVFNAVLARAPQQPLDFHQRLQAVQHFQALPEAAALAAAHKRVSNILKNQAGEWRNYPVNPDLLQHDAERQLLAALEQKNKQVEPLFGAGHYTEALTALATLRPAVDAFFDQVMVLVEDDKLRTNRLALLYQLQQLFLQVADISWLAV